MYLINSRIYRSFKTMGFLCLVLLFQASHALEAAQSEKATTKILVSISPYSLILKELNVPNIEVSVLMDTGVNPHTLQMKPSHLKKIAEADLVIWGGERLEPHLAKAFGSKKQLILSAIPELTLLGESHDDAHENLVDPHIWLSEKNHQLIAKAIALALALDQKYQQPVENNTESQAEKESVLLLVYHNAYSYLEAETGFQHDFVIFDNHNAKPGLKHWHELKQILQKAKAEGRSVCFLSAPSFSQSAEAIKLRSMVGGLNLEGKFTWAEIDPMASNKVYDNFSSYLFESKQTLLDCVGHQRASNDSSKE